jgi:hypothetical protein
VDSGRRYASRPSAQNPPKQAKCLESLMLNWTTQKTGQEEG